MQERIKNTIFLVQMNQDYVHPNSYTELITRLKTLGSEYEKLMKLNEECIENDPMKLDIDFDKESGVMSVKHMGKLMHSLKLNRANPDVPVKLKSKSYMSSFVPKTDTQDTELIRNDMTWHDIAQKLESFYFNASKLWDLVEKTIFSKVKSEFIGVKMVRNKLIEHTEDCDIYSFGVSEEWGPLVKPSQITSRKEKWHDKGLKTNTEELINKIEARFTTLIKN